jgi:hypothetical protein
LSLETSATPSSDEWCAHCQDKLIGFSQVGDDRLCHPSVGLDCYRLTEIYHHPMPCQSCTDVRRLLNNMISPTRMLYGH